MPIEPQRQRIRDRRTLGMAALAGLALTIIGVRFLLWPESAVRFFGLGSRPLNFELHYVVALRDLWLGLLALGLVISREWRALALWLSLGAAVCFGDAIIVAAGQGKPASILFHVSSGVFCAALAGVIARRMNQPATVDTVK